MILLQRLVLEGLVSVMRALVGCDAKIRNAFVCTPPRTAVSRLRFLLASALVSFATAVSAQVASHQGLWWAAPAGSESGWGINLTHQGDAIFATWFTYDENGRDLWLVALLQATAPDSFAGDIYRTTGPGLSNVGFDPTKVTERLVGHASLTLADASSATFTYTVGSITQSKLIAPQAFRLPPTCRMSTPDALQIAGNYTGLWWSAPAGSQSGWGINFAHQEDVIFATWFTYDTDGEPLWLAAAMTRQDGLWSGDLFRTSGPAFGATFDPSKVTETTVGSATLQAGYEDYQADGNTATFTYHVGSLTRSQLLTREVFEAQVSDCTQIYTVNQIRDAFAQAQAADLSAAIGFARDRGLSAFHVDFLTGSAPGTTLHYERDHMLGNLSGGARIAGYKLPFNQMIQLTSDVTQVRYPADYQAAAKTVAVDDPYCNPAPDTIVFPAAYLGQHALPEVKLVAHGTSFRRIAWLKDVWSKPNPSYIPGCRGDTRQAFSATLARLKKLGTDAIFVTPWTSFDTSVTPWRVLNPAETRSSTIDDDDLEWIVQTAKAAGFAVYWRNQIQGAQSADGQPLPSPSPTVENVLKSYDALESYLKERGAFLQRIGVDGVSLTSWYWAGFRTILDEPTYLDRTRRLIQNLKTTYSGKIMYDASSDVASDDYLSTAIDYYMGLDFPTLSQAELNQLSVAILKPKFVSIVQDIVSRVNGKPIIWDIDLASRADVLATADYLEETFCTPSPANCTQETKQADFGLQAIVHEAALEAIFETAPAPFGIDVQYWMDDNLLPTTTFPNVAVSIRGKPAEAIIQQWFAR